MATIVVKINYAPLQLKATLAASRFSIFLCCHRNGVSKTIPANVSLVNYFDEKKKSQRLSSPTSRIHFEDQGHFSHSIENHLHIFFLRICSTTKWIITGKSTEVDSIWERLSRFFPTSVSFLFDFAFILFFLKNYQKKHKIKWK